MAARATGCGRLIAAAGPADTWAMRMLSFALWTAVLLMPAAAAAADPADPFRGERAHADVVRIVDFGPRTLGNEAAVAFRAWLRDLLVAEGWQVSSEPFVVADGQGVNVLAWRGEGAVDLIGAHYDTRAVADADPDPSRRTTPGPGANDGASGVAVLAELARTVRPQPGQRICLAFFDAEDDGGLSGREWAEGSAAWVFAAIERGHACWPPRAAVIVDMVGDGDQTILRETHSDPGLDGELRRIARRLGHASRFPDRLGPAMMDDHRPFLDAGIPTVLLIDFEYAHWHTHADVPAAVSADSLAAVGRVVAAWLGRRPTEQAP